MPRAITQYYRPPGSGDVPTFAPSEANTQFCNSGGMQG